MTQPSKRKASARSFWSVQGEVHIEGLEHCPRIVVHAWLRPCAWSDVWNTNRVSRAHLQPASR